MGQFQQHGIVERFQETCIYYTHLNTFPLKHLCCFFRHLNHRAAGQHRIIITGPQPLPGTDRQNTQFGIQRHAGSVNPRIPVGNRPVIIFQRRLHHMAKLVLILRHHHDHIRNMAHKGNIVYPLMSLAVSADKACPVNREHNIGVMAADVMDDLIVGPLHKG